MKIIAYFSILLCLSAFQLSAQTKEINETNQLLIGQWLFVKTLNENNDEIKYVIEDKKDSNGNEIKILANGPDITINPDYTYIKKFTEENSDKGNWKLITTNEIEYEMVIPQDSRQGNLIKETQKLFETKWRVDSNGNYLDSSIDKIVLLTENEMRVEFHKKYVLVYRKKLNSEIK